MKIIKLNAIDSTNSFLKELATSTILENLTIVTTENQVNGRGQLNANWHSEPFKNLTFSIFINNLNLKIDEKKYLNFAISLAIFEVLYYLKIPNLKIKWPNDIMSDNKKICGLLIENTFKGEKIKNSIIGIGLNVNQIEFPNSLQNVSSLKLITSINFDKEIILNKIIKKIEEYCSLLKQENFNSLENSYLKHLYKKEITSMFKTDKKKLFMGIIKGISSNGNLLVELEDSSIKEFGVKEISFA